MSETDFFAENAIVNDNIKLAIKKINKATMVKRNDLIVELVNHPIRWCGIISEVSEDSILLDNESIDGYFIFSKLPFFVINNKIKIIFILKNRNIAANLNKGDRIYAKNKAIYSTKNDEIISLYILLDEISIYKYNKSLFRFNDKKERFEPANDIFEFNNIIFESKNF
jgi:hypothetical protein